MSYNLSVGPSCPVPYLGPSLAQVCPGSQFLTFMTILDIFVRSQDKVSQLCERVKPVDPAEYYHDFIVVGGEYKSISEFYPTTCRTLTRIIYVHTQADCESTKYTDGLSDKREIAISLKLISVKAKVRRNLVKIPSFQRCDRLSKARAT